MKIATIYLLTILSCLLLLVACDKESDHFINGDLMVSFGVVEKNQESADTNYIIRLDNGDRIISAQILPQGIELSRGQRVQVTFSPSEEKIGNDKKITYYGRINSVRTILFKNILRISGTICDSIGNDPVSIRESWVTGDSILTVNFNYFTNGSVHSVNLVSNTGGDGTDQPYIFEFRHNAKDDQQNYRSPGIVSFDLSPFKKSDSHKIDFILRYTDYDGKQTDLPHTISY